MGIGEKCFYFSLVEKGETRLNNIIMPEKETLERWMKRYHSQWLKASNHNDKDAYYLLTIHLQGIVHVYSKGDYMTALEKFESLIDLLELAISRNKTEYTLSEQETSYANLYRGFLLLYSAWEKENISK